MSSSPRKRSEGEAREFRGPDETEERRHNVRRSPELSVFPLIAPSTAAMLSPVTRNQRFVCPGVDLGVQRNRTVQEQ